uniref:Exosome complex component RRP45 n=1 Tax=Phallusia mammillata TaxID=59560 RepID=A0A6F9DCU7_9ASCI|nr:exosome complex component RRP45 [Phallusia mammillata]
MPLREPTLSNLENNFIVNAVCDNRRYDGRRITDARDTQITLGLDYGCCTVSLGETKVMAQVAVEMERPKESRPSEGSLHIHVEMSTLASGNFDASKPGELGIEIQRILERSIILSRCLDLEELCIRVGERSWAVHLYIHVLCYDGNILDCASIAAITSLKHFRRPDITVEGKTVLVHSIEERNPLPLTMHHMPFCTTMAFFKDSKQLLVDPTRIEEKVMDGKLIISINNHKEVCCMQICGQVHISKPQILHSTDVAYLKSKELSEFVKNVLTDDLKYKQNGEKEQQVSLLCKRNLHVKENLMCNQHKKENLLVEIVNPITTTENFASELKKAPEWLTKHDSKTVSVGEGLINSWGKVGSSFFKSIKKPELPNLESNSEDENDSDEEIITLNQTS